MKKSSIYIIVIVAVGFLAVVWALHRMIGCGINAKDSLIIKPCTVKLEKLETQRDNKLSDTRLKAVPVHVNGVECLMLLDTGCSRTMLSQDFCNKHALTGRRLKVNRKNSDFDVSRMTEIKGRLRVGGVVVDNFPFLQHDLSDMAEFFNGGNEPVVGILGGDFLNRLNYSLDVQAGVLSLGLAETPRSNASSEVPIAVIDNLVFFDVTIQEKTFKFMLDTGASLPHLNAKDFALCSGEIREIKSEQFTARGVSNNLQKFAKLASVSLLPNHSREILFQIDEDNNLIPLSMLKDWVVAVYPSSGYMLFSPHEKSSF